MSSSDIVERLRYIVSSDGYLPGDEALLAADEIERLRAALAYIRDQEWCGDCNKAETADEALLFGEVPTDEQ